MQITGKILSVGVFKPSSVFKGKEGNEIAIPSKRQLIIQQDSGDIVVVKARCDEADKWEVGKSRSFGVLNFARSNGMIFADCEVR